VARSRSDDEAFSVLVTEIAKIDNAILNIFGLPGPIGVVITDVRDV
jgi:hypothetical protein